MLSPNKLAFRTRVRCTTSRFEGQLASRGSQKLISFCDNDYLGLSFHPNLIAASHQAASGFGTGAGASRLVSGNHPLYAQLERELAYFTEADDALVFGSAYLANIGIIPALAGREDLILADRQCHASLIDGIRLSGATFRRFLHNDTQHLLTLLQQLRRQYQRCIIVTEGIFSMDGDCSPITDIYAIAQQFDATLLVDDAHGFGITGGGRGSLSEHHLKPTSDLIMIGNFAKSCGSYGGFVCATTEHIEHFVNRARSVIYTTGLPPSVVAVNLEALNMIRNKPELTHLPLKHARMFTKLLGLTDAQSPIVPLIIGSDKDTLKAAESLEEHGFLVAPIRPPTVAEGSGRLRFTFSALHREDDITRLAASIRDSDWFSSHENARKSSIDSI